MHVKYFLQIKSQIVLCGDVPLTFGLRSSRSSSSGVPPSSPSLTTQQDGGRQQPLPAALQSHCARLYCVWSGLKHKTAAVSSHCQQRCSQTAHVSTVRLVRPQNPSKLIHGSKLLLRSSRAGSKTIFVVANLWGFERPRPIHGSYSGSVYPQVCYNVINIMIYGRRGCIFVWLNNVSRKAYGIITVSCNKSNE